jgi:vacuolar-type H+-ATPase subunit E/Vma4
MKDLYKQLIEDEKYQQILESADKEERKAISAYMEKYMKAWQEQFFNPLEKLMKEKEFVDAISKKMNEVIDNSGE